MNIRKIIKEEIDDFDWIQDTPAYQKVPQWNGRDRGTPIMGRDGGMIYVFDNEEYKVGGITYRYSSRNYKGDPIYKDGDVRLYDASIVDKEIDDMNKYGVDFAGDPFEGKRELKLSRSEWNKHARSGRLLMKPSGLNESSDFDWIKTTEEIEIGGYKDIPKDTAKLGDRVKTTYGKTFTLEEISQGGVRWVWGRELGWVSRDEKNWHNPLHLIKVTDINESEDFGWIKDEEPLEEIDLTDEEHVNTISVGDKLELTGIADGEVELVSEPCTVVKVGKNTWTHQILVSFERTFYSDEYDEETHCGPGGLVDECNCREVEGVVDHDGKPYMLGTCWWVWVPDLNGVIRIKGDTAY
jgi:hypothetical protein